jgi:hypothetical protein cresD4_03593
MQKISFYYIFCLLFGGFSAGLLVTSSLLIYGGLKSRVLILAVIMSSIFLILFTIFIARSFGDRYPYKRTKLFNALGATFFVINSILLFVALHVGEQRFLWSTATGIFMFLTVLILGIVGRFFSGVSENNANDLIENKCGEQRFQDALSLLSFRLYCRPAWIPWLFHLCFTRPYVRIGNQISQTKWGNSFVRFNVVPQSSYDIFIGFFYKGFPDQRLAECGIQVDGRIVEIHARLGLRNTSPFRIVKIVSS